MINRIPYRVWRVPLHIMFWLCLSMVYIVFFGYTHDQHQFTITFVFMLMPILILSTYFLSYYLVPRYLLKKRYGKFLLYTFYTIIIASDLNLLVVVGSFAYLANYQFDNMNPFSANIVFLLFTLIFTFFIMTSIKLLKFWYQEEQSVKDLKNKQLEMMLKLRETELKLLKGQIHPHFLFNTLNNLYGLALEHSKDLPEYMIKLSDMLSYLLYSGKKEFVPLSDEMQLIQNYIDLEKLRYEERIHIQWDVPSNIPDVKIHPFILFPFVENAFKHGFTNDNRDLRLSISLKSDLESITFEVENSKPLQQKNFHQGGIGLDNLKQRLEMIYPQQYQLDFHAEPLSFYVKLVLDIHD